jgi:serine/threonine protein kinase
MSSEERGTISFMAPELLFSAKFGLDKGVPSKEADIYALGMTVYQVLTDKWPFFPRREAEVIHAVISGERPPKPENAESIGITEVLWDLLRECWGEDRKTRPNIAGVLERFCHITGVRRTTDSTIGASGLQLDTGFSRDSIHSETTIVQCEWGDSSFERSYPTRLRRTDAA